MLGSLDLRAQLLANLKCLHGSDVEVLTLRDDSNDGYCQAVAIKTNYQALNTTSTEVMRTEAIYNSSKGAVEALCKESELQIAKVFVAKNNIPTVKEATLGNLAPDHTQRGDSVSADSSRLHPDGVPALKSCSSDATSRESISAQPPAGYVVPSEPLRKDSLVQTVVEEARENPVPEESMLACKMTNALSQESEMFSSIWHAPSIIKKKNAKAAFDEDQAAEKFPAEDNAQRSSTGNDKYLEVSPNASFVTAITKNEEGDGNRLSDGKVFESEIGPASQPVDDIWDFGLTSKKKKKSRALRKEEKPLPAETGLDLTDDFDFDWAAFATSKKVKKEKRSQSTFEQGLPDDNEDRSWKSEFATSKPTDEVPDEDPWASFGTSKSRKKKESNKPLGGDLSSPVLDSKPDSTPQPADDFEWVFSTSSKKDKKKKKLEQKASMNVFGEEEPSVEPAQENAVLRKPSFSNSPKEAAKSLGLEDRVPVTSNLFDKLFPAASKTDSNDANKLTKGEDKPLSEPAAEAIDDFDWGVWPTMKKTKKKKGSKKQTHEKFSFQTAPEVAECDYWSSWGTANKKEMESCEGKEDESCVMGN